jgi:hypothetical protein
MRLDPTLPDCVSHTLLEIVGSTTAEHDVGLFNATCPEIPYGGRSLDVQPAQDPDR